MSKTIFTTGTDKKSMVIERTFTSPLKKVWQAWTTQELLEQWWAPLPWKAVTKTFDFSEGGQWLYAMTSPEGEKHWAVVRYQEIDPEKYFTALDQFCDEEGIPNPDMPSNVWTNVFKAEGDKTHLKVTLTFTAAQDMDKIVEMGFKEGFTQGLDQLEALLQQTT